MDFENHEQDEKQGEVVDKFEAPPKRQFLLRRVKIGTQELEEILIEAHSVQFGDDGILGFLCIVNDPVLGIRNQMQHVFHDWYDMRELNLSPSTLLVH